MSDNKSKRPKPFSYRPPQHLREAFEKRVRESGLAINAFITEAVFGRTRHRPAELKLLGRILARCADIADGVKRTSSDGSPATQTQLETIASELRLIRTALMRMMGRKS